MSGIGTKCVQSGYRAKNGEPRQLPIYQSTTYRYETSGQLANIFNLEDPGYMYTRLANPTNDAVAAKICELEGGKAAILTSSGQAASFFSIFNLCSSGDHVVCSSSIYGGTYNLFKHTMSKMGIDFTFVRSDASLEELDVAFQPNTKAVFGETVSNPSLAVLDIETFAKAAHNHGVPLIIDNTFATPINCRPIEWGCDLVVHSTTKYMDGHAGTVGGAIVDAGNFDWMAHKDKFPSLCTPDDSYHGVVYAEKFGKEGAFITKCTAHLMRDFGSIQSPQNAYYINLGLESLHVRVQRHTSNGRTLATFLESHPAVESVNYPDLPSNPYYELAKKYLPNGSSGVVSVTLKGGRIAAEKFMEALKLFSIETHVSDSRCCCLCPSLTTHRQMSEEELLAAGVPAGLVRLSCGLEDPEDIIADVKNALDSVSR